MLKLFLSKFHVTNISGQLIYLVVQPALESDMIILNLSNYNLGILHHQRKIQGSKTVTTLEFSKIWQRFSSGHYIFFCLLQSFKNKFNNNKLIRNQSIIYFIYFKGLIKLCSVTHGPCRTLVSYLRGYLTHGATEQEHVI